MQIEHLAGFGIRGFRSFGHEDVQLVGPMAKVHLIAGKNNVGKSNAVSIARRVLPSLRHQNIYSSALFPFPRDYSAGSESPHHLVVRVGLYLDETVRELLSIPEDSQSAFGLLSRTPAFSFGTENAIWFEYDLISQPDVNDSAQFSPSTTQLNTASQQAHSDLPHYFSGMAMELTSTAADLTSNYLSVMSRLNPLRLIPETSWIEAKRAIGSQQFVRAGDTPDIAFQTGRGLFSQIAALQNPEADHLQDRRKFDRLESFVREVLEDNSARVSVASSHNDLMVETRGRNDSYTNLGTGIGEVVHIAAVVSMASNKLLCIEEPEIHLHPTLQRKMLQFFVKDPDNRYLISTHSASMLDSAGTSLTHATQDALGWTKLDSIDTRRHRSLAVDDLGNRASDLVQSNFLLWVEGPSDRLYLNYWLKACDPDLLEGGHFSIMFYGGSLLNHLAYDDEDVSGFIELAQINRHMAIVIDSDRTSANQALNRTKTRVVEELNAANSVSWVTSGYTIENYVPVSVLQIAVEKAHTNRPYAVIDDPFQSPLGRPFDDSDAAKPNKVSVARQVVEVGLPWASWPDDLKSSVAEIVGRIRLANGMELLTSN